MLDEAERARIHRHVLEAVQDGGWQSTMAVRLCMLGSSVAVLPRSLDGGLETGSLEALVNTSVNEAFNASSPASHRSIIRIES